MSKPSRVQTRNIRKVLPRNIGDPDLAVAIRTVGRLKPDSQKSREVVKYLGQKASLLRNFYLFVVNLM